MIVTGNGGDKYRELMGGPCFDAMEMDFMIEQVETTEKHYIGEAENIPDNVFSQKINLKYRDVPASMRGSIT